MKIRKSSIAAAVATLALGSMLAVSTPAIANTPSLTVWYPDDKKATYVDVITAWGKANDVNVTLVGREFGGVRDLLKTAVPAGTGPDVLVGAAHDWTGSLVSAAVVRPISLSSQILSGLTPNSVSAFAIKNRQYGVPAYTENLAFIRNVKKAPKPVTNLSSIKNGELAVPYGVTGGDAYHFYPLQTAFDAPVLVPTSNGFSSTVGMAGTNGENFAKFLNKGSKFFGNGGYGQLCDFINGKIKYWITGPWNIKNIQEGAAACKTGLKLGSGYSIDAFPAGPNGVKGVPFLGAKGSFLTNSPQTDVVNSMRLINYLASKEAGIAFFNAEYAAPANKAALEVASNDAAIKAFAAVGAKVRPMPNIVAMDSIWDKWGKTQAKILTGKSTNPVTDWREMNKSITENLSNK
jgi:arabinogalactan oligomer/maltooligosaccharide transport system substrate-binding protein